ncbi:hypothetical protein LX64_01324 [Chitinophaga skermanii]|uniref:Uncharacterized protein n=1 Tax=Chitinophaga skermanii TaxID=331697 RepID=A0A327QWE2_9BACT|nr:hypothetical protein [Chitinophaga skermanii]RAJ08670.1 hypothetical protein LX64_01324 [Chitinophaga skermanii]
MLGKNLSRTQMLRVAGGQAQHAAVCNRRVTDCALECPSECSCDYAHWGNWFCSGIL